ncbi:TPA: hypothetical protein ACGOVU_001681 [Streptococcus suis]
MKKGYKITFEKHVKIVNYSLAHEKDYQIAVERLPTSIFSYTDDWKEMTHKD